MSELYNEMAKIEETDVYYDENGRKQMRTETETTKDPKGLFNKSTSKSVHSTN